MLGALLTPKRTAVHSVLVGGHAADFACTDPIANINIGSTPEDAKNSHFHPELKRKLYSAFQEGDDGELAIAVPSDVSLKPQPTVAAMGEMSEGASYQADIIASLIATNVQSRLLSHRHRACLTLS